MKRFEGFPSRMEFTSVPNIFFSKLMPEITDISELKVTLHIFRLLYGKKGYPRYVTFNELLGDAGVMESIDSDAGDDVSPVLADILGNAGKRGTVVSLDFEREGETETLYFLNTERNREAVENIKDGSLVLEGLTVGKHTQTAADNAATMPDIFTLYEENVGMLNPLIAEWLKEAEKIYPEAWIREAIKEAVSLNKRSWRYIDRILENWAAEGKKDGAHRGNTKPGTEKYRNQKYDYLIRRR